MLREILESKKVSNVVDVLNFFKKHGWSKGKIVVESLQDVWLPFTPIDSKSDNVDVVTSELSKMGVTYVKNSKDYVSVKFNLVPETK